MNKETKMEIEVELKDLNVTIQNIDFLYQDGVIFNSADIKTMSLLSEQLNEMLYDIKFQSAYKLIDKT